MAAARNAKLTQRGKLPLHRFAYRGQIAQRVLVINLAQDIVRQSDAVDSPAAMQRRAGGRAKLGGMIEVLIVGLEKSPVRNPELFDSPAGIPVGTEQNTVLILQEKFANHAWRAAQILNRRR